MSILSSPKGSPERVYAILYAKRHAGAGSQEECAELVNPGAWSAGEQQQANKTLFADGLSVARALGLEDAFDTETAPASFDAWSDDVHDRLLRVEDAHLDAVLLRSYAWLVAKSDKSREVSWFVAYTNPELADAIGAGLGPTSDGQPAMNPTKLTAWRRWMTYLGLLTPLPLPNMRELPVPARRLHRELARSEFKAGQEVDASEFLQWISQRMPYLDGGRLFAAAAAQIGHRRTATNLSPVLSLALQDLHERGVIRMRVVGDRAGAMQLSGDATHAVTSFHAITIGTI